MIATAGLCAGAAPAAEAACRGADAHPSDTKLASIRTTTLCLLNRERSKRRIRGLRHNRRLASAARLHAIDMVRRDYFGHTTPGGTDFLDRILRQDYVDRQDGYAVGENLAWGSHQLATPRSIVRSWMRSPGHKRNILDRRFREIGVSVVRGAPQPGQTRAATYATEFGTRWG